MSSEQFMPQMQQVAALRAVASPWRAAFFSLLALSMVGAIALSAVGMVTATAAFKAERELNAMRGESKLFEQLYKDVVKQLHPSPAPPYRPSGSAGAVGSKAP